MDHTRWQWFKQKEGHLDFTMEKTDVVLFVHQAWKECFAAVERNKKAAAERGLGPLIYVLLDHPELKKSQGSINGVIAAYLHLELTREVPINLPDLNTDNGLAGNLMEKL